MGTSKLHASDDVQIVGIRSFSKGSRRKPLTKSSRREESRSEVVTLCHLPSGRQGSVEIPAGHYSKKEMQRLREEAKMKFLKTLK